MAHASRIEPPEALVATDVQGVALVVANVDGTLLAYRNACASCGGALDGGALEAASSAVPGCGRSFFLPQAGRSLDDDHLQLQPVPLLREAGSDQGRAVKPLEAVASRRKASMVSGLRGLAQPKPPAPAPPRTPASTAISARPAVPGDHRHMLNLYERQIVCVCESCWALRSGDAEFRPTGNRTLWLEDFELPEEIWAQFRIPIGLAFFMYSSVTDCVVALYPSPAGATESELHFETWSRLADLNPVLRSLEPDAEALIVNRTAEPPAYAIAPIDRCYMLVGPVKASWEGISGGAGVEQRDRGLFRGAQEGRRRETSRSCSRRLPVAPEPEFQVLAASAAAATRPCRPSISTSTSASRAAGRST